MLPAGLPVREGLEALLAQVLFSQMLCLPHPPLKPLAYSAIMVGAILSTCVHLACPVRCWILRSVCSVDLCLQ